MRSIPRFPLIVGFLALMLIIAACGGAPQEATEPSAAALPVVKLQGMEGGTSAAATIIIQQQGFDKAHGFQAELYQVGGDASAQFLLQRNSDVNFDCDLVTAAVLRSQGNKISTFYPVVAQDAVILVRGDSPYQKPEDLIGKKVGHDGLESGNVTAANIMLDEFNDIQIEEDYDLQLTEEGALLRLLDRGDLDAIFMSQPEVIVSEVEFGTKSIWGPASEVWMKEKGGRNWAITMCAYEDWLVENPDLARGVMAAWDDALAWIKEDPSRLKEAPFPELFGIEDPVVLDKFAELVGTTEYFTNSWTEEDVQAGRDFLKSAAEMGTIIQEVPENSIVRLEDLVGK
jgi:NitT/TauT family transport system substrate-binding protein